MKHTNDDIVLIAKQMQAAKKRGKPFALLTGAGCSRSAGIPLAKELIDEINDPEKDYYINLQGLTEKQRRDYGCCMSRLGLNVRNDLLGPYLKNAKMNWAHIAMALLIKAGFVERVLTFNFDNVLARACGLCGEYPATYDYATASSNSSEHIVSPAIIHLHGQGTGLSMLNDDNETQAHVNNIAPLLLNTLDNAPLLVTGYSGMADPVFDKLKSLYGRKENLYWCDYSESPQHHVQEFIQQYPTHVFHYGKVNSDDFLVRIAQELDCFSSTVFTDPVQHLRNEIQDVPPFSLNDEKTDNGRDILKNLKQQLDQLEAYNEQTHTEKQLPNFEEMLLKGEDQKIIDLYEKSYSDNISIDLTLIAEAYINEALKTNDPHKALILEQRAAELNPNSYTAFFNWGVTLSILEEYALACEKYQQASYIEPSNDSTFYNWGNALANLEQYELACEKYQQANKINPDHQNTLCNWGVALTKLDRYTCACEKYQQANKINSEDYEILYNWGNALASLKKYELACEKYQQANKINPEDCDILYIWGVSLAQRKQYKLACEKYQQANKINPNEYRTLNSWSIALLLLYHQTNNKHYLEECEQIIKSSLHLNPEEAYNAACLAALQGNEGTCRTHLITCKEASTLPDIDHVKNDKDLEFVQEKDWFIRLLNDL